MGWEGCFPTHLYCILWDTIMGMRIHQTEQLRK